jgi:hypothetical protein
MYSVSNKLQGNMIMPTISRFSFYLVEVYLHNLLITKRVISLFQYRIFSRFGDVTIDGVWIGN